MEDITLNILINIHCWGKKKYMHTIYIKLLHILPQDIAAPSAFCPPPPSQWMVQAALQHCLSPNSPLCTRLFTNQAGVTRVVANIISSRLRGLLWIIAMERRFSISSKDLDELCLCCNQRQQHNLNKTRLKPNVTKDSPV